MDRHASIRRHAGLRIVAIRRHAGLRIAGAQDHEEPALRYQVETQLVDVIRGSNPKCWTCVPAAGRSISPRPGSVQVRVQGRRRGGAATAWRACYGMQGKECWDMVKVSTAMDKDRSTGAWCTLSPVLRTWAHVHAYVYCEFGVCLAGNLLLKFARAPHSTIQRSAPRFILRTRLPTQNSPPLPRGTDSRHAGLHTARPRASAGRRRPASGRGGVGPPNTTPSPPRGGPLGTAAWLVVRQLCG